MVRGMGVITATLALSCGSAPVATPECAGDVQVLTTALVASRHIEADCVVVRAGSAIQIGSQNATVVRARAVVIEGEARIDGVGEDGTPHAPWTSGGPNCFVAHADWSNALSGSVLENQGRAGQDGGQFELRYGRIIGGSARLALLRFDLRGGAGGPGRELRCGCAATSPSHADHISHGPRGANGQMGAWRFIEEVE